MPKITFFLRSNNDKSNSHVLYCRVTFNGSKAEFSLKEKVYPGEWNQENQKFTGAKIKQQFISVLLDTVRYKLKSIALQNETMFPRELIAMLHPKPEQKIPLSTIVENYIASVELKSCPGTIRNHKVKLANLLEFQKITKIEYDSNTFSLVEAERFKEWFMNRIDTTFVDTANRNILLYRSALIWAQKRGEIKEFELIHYQGEKDKIKSPVFLTMEDLEKIRRKQFSSKMLNQVRDLFLFQCASGLSYSDLWSDWRIEETESGSVIVGTRQKNGQSFFVPVTNDLPEILEKYNYSLPKYSNGCYNRCLKEIAAFCEIDLVITTHTARKTFATLKDAQGWSRETVSKMLGHRSVKTTEVYYLGESNSRILEEMKRFKISA